MRLVVKFSKEDMVKYISHLDIMRSMQRALRRASLPVAFTQGFNPHPKIAFASALSVGLTSEGEYMDIVFEHNIDSDEFTEKLNKVLPLGLRVLKSVTVDDKLPSLMSMIERAEYRIRLPFCLDEFSTKLDAFYNQAYILVAREVSDSLQYTNIRPLIHSIKQCSDEAFGNEVEVMLNSGSKSNLKPQVFADALLRFLDSERFIGNSGIHRLDLYLFENGKLITPLELVDVC